MEQARLPEGQLLDPNKKTMIRLYRGVQLWPDAKKLYDGYLDSGTEFFFTAFTSTSLDMAVAVDFAT